MMEIWWKRLVFEWNVCRIVRLVAGIPILIMGIDRSDWPVILFGAAFIAAGLFSMQCCATGSCSSDLQKKYDADKPIEFEEIK